MSFNADKITGGGNLAKGINRNISRGLGMASPFLGFLWDILIFIASIFAFPIRIFLRNNFGERAIGGLSIALSALWLIFAGEFLISWGLIMTRRAYLYSQLEAHTVYQYVYLVFFLIFSIHSLNQARKRRKKGIIKIYSYYRGDSIFFPKKGQERFNNLSNASVWTFTEPFFVLGLGMLVRNYLDPVLGFILFIGAIALFIEEYGVYQKAKSIELDLVDVELESEYVDKVEKELELRFSGNSNTLSTTKNIAGIPSEEEVEKYFNYFQSNKT